MTLAPMLPCGQSPDAASINQISKRPFRAAPLLRRKFAAERRTAQGRLCRPEHFNAEGWSRLAGGGTKKVCRYLPALLPHGLHRSANRIR